MTSNKTMSGLFKYDRDYLPEIVEQTLSDIWIRNAPSWYKYEEYNKISPIKWKTKIHDSMISGEMRFDNRDDDKGVVVLNRVMGDLSFSVHYGRYNESLTIDITQMRYNQMGVSISHLNGQDRSWDYLALTFRGFQQGRWHNENSPIKLYDNSHVPATSKNDRDYTEIAIRDLGYFPKWGYKKQVFQTCDQCNHRFVWKSERLCCSDECYKDRRRSD